MLLYVNDGITTCVMRSLVHKGGFLLAAVTAPLYRLCARHTRHVSTLLTLLEDNLPLAFMCCRQSEILLIIIIVIN